MEQKLLTLSLLHKDRHYSMTACSEYILQKQLSLRGAESDAAIW